MSSASIYSDFDSSSPSSPMSAYDFFDGLDLLSDDRSLIDEFSSLFSTSPPPLVSSSSLIGATSLASSSSYTTSALQSDLAKTIDQWFPIKPTKNGTPNFDDLSPFFFSQNSNNNTFLTTTSSSKTMSTPFPLSSSSLKFKVPCIPNQTEPISCNKAFFASTLPDQPELYLVSRNPSLDKNVVKRETKQRGEERYESNNNNEEEEEEEGANGSKSCKRKRCTDYFSTDGELYALLREMCEDKKDFFSSTPSPSFKQREVFKKRRALAKAKLDRKKKLRSVHFNGHYPERKAVASARKRVGGRFVKEDISVFRPVKEQQQA